MLGDFLLLSFENDRHVLPVIDHGFLLPFDENALHSRALACLAVFYLGISPVMTNSSMRLWSEFATYPWVGPGGVMDH